MQEKCIKVVFPLGYTEVLLMLMSQLWVKSSQGPFSQLTPAFYKCCDLVTLSMFVFVL